MASQMPVSILMYNRLLSYLRYLQGLPPAVSTVSSTVIGAALEVNDVQVRKDLAAVSSGGKPKIGYVTADLIADMTHFLGYDDNTDAALAGAGNLGRALLTYKNFKDYGLNIITAFDKDPSLIGTKHGDVQIRDIAKASGLCKRLNIHIGIITTPAECAQEICDIFVEGGARAVWNFAPVNLKAPETVVIRNEDIAASLAVLLRRLTANFNA
ncbi:MAG: redox-sensing transcriptional repressor Rex [Clostridiales bacterium]|jgi:redox-sensing transcriptional repressor|nr:redox-sensing transcriptional repressor Rex [Clostridiales bacterium]